MNLVQLVHQEEDESATVGGRSIVLGGDVDVDLGDLGNLDLLLDLR
jgi:hypothetical protein